MIALFRLLLHVLPRSFRIEFGDEIARTAAEQWRETRSEGGTARAVAFWGRQIRAVVAVAVTLRLGRGRRARRSRTGRGPPAPGPRDEARGEIMDGLRQDLRHALRSFAAKPGFVVVSVLTLALGIGATTAIFSAVHAVLFRDLPYDDPDRVVTVVQHDPTERENAMSAANMRDVAETASLLEAAAVAEPWSLDLMEDGRARSLRTWRVSPGFFEAIGAEAALGRTFTPEEYLEGAEPTVLLDHGLWRTRFGADPDIVGRTLTLDAIPHTVVGILPATFRFPAPASAWTPRPPASWDENARASAFMPGVARLAPGVTLEQAQAEMDRISASLAEAHPDQNNGLQLQLTPLREDLFGEVRTPLVILLGAVGFVLLIACANVAGLMLARGAQRGREYALRGALGASTGRLVRLITVETALLALAGCLLGVALALGGVRVIQLLGPDHLPRIDEVRVDAAVLLFAVGAAGLSTVLAGMGPALQLARPDLQRALGEAGRGTTRGPAGIRLRSQLLVGQIALAVVLLIGAGLLFRSFAVLLENDLGFEPEGRLAVQVFAYGYEEGGRAQFVNQAIDYMEAIPGVRNVALTTSVPLASDETLAAIDVDFPFLVDGRPRPPRGQEPVAFRTIISRSYPEVLGIPVVSGRVFELSDDASAPQVVMVNQTLERRHFPDRGAVGERLLFPTGDSLVAHEIVGVLRDVRPRGFESEMRPEVYFPFTQLGSGDLTFVVHTDGDPAPATTAVQEAIWRANPNQSIWGAATLPRLVSELLKERRFNLVLLAFFAGVALFLAAIGIYGLFSFSVEQRAGELGIRRALGGRSTHILGMVLREGTVLAVVGLGLGIVGALILTRSMQGMLYGVEPFDPATFAGLSLAVLAVTGLAAYIPARRATRVDPAEVLRQE